MQLNCERKCLDGFSIAPIQVAEDLMGLADHKGLDGLKALCQSALIRGVDVTNVCSLYRTAHLHEVTCVVGLFLPSVE